MNIRHLPLHRIWYYLTILCLPVQLGYHWWPEWSIVLGRRLDYLSPTLYVLDILIILTLLSWLCTDISFVRTVSRRVFPVLVPMFFLAGLNILTATNHQLALYSWLKAAEYLLFLSYCIQTRPSWRRTVLSMSFGVAYSSAIALLQSYLQHSIGGVFWWLGERTFSADTPGIARIELCRWFGSGCRLYLRAYAAFPHPNVLAGFLAVMIPLFPIALDSDRPPGRFTTNRNTPFEITSDRVSGRDSGTYECPDRKAAGLWLTGIWYGVSGATGLMALILTYSRSALILTGAGLLFLLPVMIGSKRIFLPVRQVFRRYPYVTVPAGFGCIILAVLSLTRIIHAAPESFSVREALFLASGRMLITHLPTGVGLGNFLRVLPFFSVSRDILFLQPVHSIYMLFLSETGVAGLLIFVMFILYLFRLYGGRDRSPGYREPKQIFGRFWPLFVLLMIGLVDHYPLTLEQGQILFTLALAWPFLYSPE